MYVVGWNTPGYMPDGCEDLATFSDSAEAKQYLIDEMLRDADNADSFGAHNLATELSCAAEDLNLSETVLGYCVTICDPDREHDLGTAYWIELGEDV